MRKVLPVKAVGRERVRELGVAVARVGPAVEALGRQRRLCGTRARVHAAIGPSSHGLDGGVSFERGTLADRPPPPRTLLDLAQSSACRPVALACFAVVPWLAEVPACGDGESVQSCLACSHAGKYAT